MDSILRIHPNLYTFKLFRIPNHLLYPFTLCQLSIELLNHYFSSSTTIPCSLQHQTIQSLEDIYKIENIILDLTVHDLLKLYLNDFITLQQLEHIFNEHNLTSKELQLLLCYALFLNHVYSITMKIT